MKHEPAFFDTNILIYAFASDGSHTDIATRLLAGGGVLAVQTLNEFASVAVRKLAMPWDEVYGRSANYARVYCQSRWTRTTEP
jgi:predicted nucleic acid-binding protein